MTFLDEMEVLFTDGVFTTDGEGLQETAEQIQYMLDILEDIELTGHESGHTDSLLLWLDGRYLPDAVPSWKALSRHEQAAQYIKWLREEKYGNS